MVYICLNGQNVLPVLVCYLSRHAKTGLPVYPLTSQHVSCILFYPLGALCPLSLVESFSDYEAPSPLTLDGFCEILRILLLAFKYRRGNDHFNQQLKFISRPGAGGRKRSADN